MRSSPNLLYLLLNRDYPESFTAYSPHTGDFHDLVNSRLPQGRAMRRQNIWFYCGPEQETLPMQGWKIHVSATPRNAKEVLERVTSVLFKYADVSFKFVVDLPMLSLLNSKRWPRGASGKFITVYPPHNQRFIELVEELDQVTAGMEGPYILSDHRYKNSRVVFYRYGSMRLRVDLNVRGEKVPVLLSPEGKLVPDQRLAYPVTPSWEKPVVPSQVAEEPENQVVGLRCGRYTVENAMTFSNAGGLYFAHDHQTGKKVVIKETRPCVNATSDGCDAIELLRKEHRLLSQVADTGIAPRPVDLFQEWEHWFLVEEFIEGVPMSRHSAANNILLRTRATQGEYDEWYAMFIALCADLIRIVNTLHSRNIVFADLSPNNLIVTPGGGLKIIDFEGAYQPGTDRATNIYTPGFISRHRLAGSTARPEDDYYSAGAVLLAYLLPINGMLHLNPQARQRFVDSIRNDIHLPDSIADLINDLMDQTENHSVPRTSAAPASALVVISCGRQPESSGDHRALVESIAHHLNSVADYQRKDRLYPADPRVFSTNPLSLGYGAAGVAYSLKKITGEAPGATLDWMLQQRITSAEYPPGLYVGMSGIAWALLEIGLTAQAEEIFRTAWNHPLLYKASDLFYGIAGWGMTALRFFQATANEVYLEQARNAGARLLASGKRSGQGLYWPASGLCPVGLAHGSSGIALFFLYLYLATGEESYLEAGNCALDFDLAQAVSTKDGGLSWGASVESCSPVYPYWRYGSAGIGIVTARFHRLMPSSRYKRILDQIFVDTDRKYAVFCGRFSGLAGIGEFLLDMHNFTGDLRYRQSANKVAEGILHFCVERNGGTSFPGELLSRLCCDYGTGSAGIALFFNRLMGKQENDFMLDSLFVEHATRACALPEAA